MCLASPAYSLVGREGSFRRKEIPGRELSAVKLSGMVLGSMAETGLLQCTGQSLVLVWLKGAGFGQENEEGKITPDRRNDTQVLRGLGEHRSLDGVLHATEGGGRT